MIDIDAEANEQQALVDSIKDQIKALPDFTTETEDNKYMRIYALLETAVDLTPNAGFLREAFGEMDYYGEKSGRFNNEQELK